MLALLIDILASGLLALLIYQSVIHPIWYQYMGGQAINQTFADVQTDSHLYRLNENEQVVEESATNYEASVTYFYLESGLFNFENTDLYHEEDHPTFDFYTDIMHRGVADTETSKGTLFVFTETVDPLTEVVTVSYVPRGDVSSNEVSLFWQTAYRNAQQHLTYASDYFTARLAIANFVFYAMSIAFILSSLFFILGFSLFFGDGRSLGKYLLGLGLVTRTGYKVTKVTVLLRYVTFVIVEVVLSFRLYFIPLFLSSAIMTLDRNQASLHDRLARTVVIDWKQSFIFRSREEETQYHQDHINGKPSEVKVTGGMVLQGLTYIPEKKKIEEANS